MKFHVSRFPGFVLILSCLMLTSCLRDEPLQGEVARINGRAITLKQVEAMHHALFVEEDVDGSEEMEHLRQQYGTALTELMAMELVKQELERKKLAVTPDELSAEEQLIRADYPPGTFDIALAEDAIDLDTWRYLLGNHLAMRKFQRQVLRPEIAINSEEVEDYYFRHTEIFVRPERLEYILLCGQQKALVDEARSLLLETLSPTEVRNRFPEVLVSQSSLPLKRVDPEILAAAADLAPGEASLASRSKRGYSSVLLLERESETSLTPTEAYSLIENALLERKLQAAQTEWLQARFAKASIRVAAPLRPDPAAKERPVDTIPEARNDVLPTEGSLAPAHVVDPVHDVPENAGQQQ